MTDASIAVKQGEEGYIHKVAKLKLGNGYHIVKIVIRTSRDPENADKFASRSAQKGTCGITLHEDMPFTASGITPDIIINPHAIQSRMTISQLLECVLGKANSLGGDWGDATAWNTLPNSESESCYLFKTKTVWFWWNELWGHVQWVFWRTHWRAYFYWTNILPATKTSWRKSVMRAKGQTRRSHADHWAFAAWGHSVWRNGARLHNFNRHIAVFTWRLYEVSDPFSIDVCQQCRGMASSIYYCKACNQLT